MNRNAAKLSSATCQEKSELNDDKMTCTPANSRQHYQQAQRPLSHAYHRHNRHDRRPSTTNMFGSRQRYAFTGLAACFILFMSLVLTPSTNQLVEAGKVKKAVKSIAKGLIYQQLSTRKNFLPLPVPIPVPIEINEDPIYLKGKPKYVNIYKPPKPTSAPVVKPTTVYHMPIYSPTYEYMSMDPMNSMYGAQMMYANPYAGGPSSYKSSVNTDSDSTSSVASASHGLGGGPHYGGINFNDYDDESGSYYMKKSAARRRKLMPGEYASSADMHRIDIDRQHALARGETPYDYADSSSYSGPGATSSQNHDSSHEDSALETAQPSDDESYDDENEHAAWIQNRDSTHHGHRSKRQVYYESGYDGQANCEGFPLEINVRSRIKLDQIFPIFGKSQMRKCVKIRKNLLPPPQEHY